MITGNDPYTALRADEDFGRLLNLSARVGRDPLQVQGAGGNSSLKGGGAMWVKASGTWLADAEMKDIMVPVRAADLAAELAAGGEPDAVDFVAPNGGPQGLRPSIETTLHAAMPQRVVLHTHCVATIALAIRQDGGEILRRELEDLDPIFLPYVMPGLPLAKALLAEASPERRVAILGNHGLIVAGDSPEEVEALLSEVSGRLERAVAPPLTEGVVRADERNALFSARYRAVEAPSLQAVARSPRHLALTARGPFFPDYVVFLEPDLRIAEENEPVETAADRLTRDGEAPTLVLLPGIGAAIRRDASPAAEAMARALGDVIARVPPEAPVRALPSTEVAALLGWDAEKYRRALSSEAAQA